MNSIILLSSLGILTLFTGVFNWRKMILPIVVIGLIGIFGLNFLEWNNAPAWYAQFNHMLLFDNYSIAFTGTLIIISLFIFFLCDQHYAKDDSHVADIYALILFTLVGGIIMASYSNLTMLFLGIEILSIPLYILAGSKKIDLASNEASIKYFLMGSFSTGFLLFGIALIFGTTGSLDLNGIRQYIEAQQELPMIFNIGLVLMLVGLTFKVSAVPFHFWAPDVYTGSPTLITTFMATVVKTAGFAALFRLMYTCFGTVDGIWFNTLWAIAALTITVGNLSALYQKNVKRMLAYSSISNAGYLLIGVVANNAHSDSAILYYTFVYSIATILAFAVLMLVMEEKGGNAEYTSFNGLARNNPLLAGVMCVAMLSLAGIPPLAGFFAKYYMFRTALENDYIWIVVIAVINSLIGVYYYFRVMVSMFSKEPDQEKVYVKASYQAVLIIGALLLLVLGIFPNLITEIL